MYSKGKKVIYCRRCVGEINSRDDLVVTTHFFELVPYHNECYSKILKSGETIFVSNKPINGPYANILMLLSMLLGIVLLFIPGLRYLSTVCLIGLLMRVYSWFKIERHL